MTKENQTMRPIWFFVGIMLLVTGAIIFLAGLYQAAYPEDAAIAGRDIFKDLHPSIWWGGVMMLAGLVYLVVNRKARE
jgi:hypothetical protein